MRSLRRGYFYLTMYYRIDAIRDKFYELEWYEVYDLIEFLINNVRDSSAQSDFVAAVSKILEEERAPYKLLDGRITPLTSEIEVTEIERALNADDKYRATRNHLSKALELYSKRPTPDYANSIKESISAVEALARIILGKENATFGSLADSLPIHSALKDALKKLYGWTSDEGGIRHSEKSTSLQPNEEEARFMLVICAAFVNYVIAKHDSN